MSQTDFAARLGISRVRLNNYITGRSEPDLGSLTRIADVLEFSVDYLLGRHPGSDAVTLAFTDEIAEYSDGPAEPLPCEGEGPWVPLHFARQQPPVDGYSSQPLGWLRLTAGKGTAHPYFRKYALLMGDDSMSPEMMPGDIACVQPAHLSHFFLSGDAPSETVYAVRLHAGDTVGIAPRHCYARDNLLITFTGNRRYTPTIIDMNRATHEPIVGKVVGVWRSCSEAGIHALLRSLDQ